MAMKLKVQQVFDATLALKHIIDRGAAMPVEGRYRVIRMHAKLLTEFAPICEQRDALISAYDYREEIDGVPSLQFSVPVDKMAEFSAAWKDIAEQEIEVEVEPLPLGQLELDHDVEGSVSFAELIALGDLVAD